MSNNSTPCHYHPDRNAITVCERCRRPICQEDKRNYRKKNYSGTNQFTHAYFTNQDYCVLCNASQLRADVNPRGFLIFIPFVVILFFIFGTSFFAIFDINVVILIAILLVVIVIMAIGSVYSTRSKAEAAEREAMIFKSNLYSQSDSSSRPAFNYAKTNPIPSNYEDVYERKPKKEIMKDPTLFSIVCFECGAPITLQDKFCQKCGSSTHDELVAYYKLH